ncbi:fimbrial protein [Cronobacter dublinensis subsp. beijingensis]|uniref:fimbrial protein n=1 Tax=Cronobacter dublinensis TaxID=413497 RepID=UPI0023D9BC74|nr:fimbrial protein [Cronobacter dublinensis]WEP49083.1 fimbrial protein [Cronobacter dublinensis]
MKYFLRALCFASATCAAYPVAAQDVNMTFHGTLIAPPCTINNEQTIDVRFGDDLAVEKIDGTNYLQPVNYRVTCAAGYTPNNLAIVIETTNPTSFDESAIQTSKKDLGLHILVNGLPVTFGQRVAINDIVTLPLIQAVPVQSGNGILTAGAFEASMTLRIDYV